jgi:hypothetical protein
MDSSKYMRVKKYKCKDGTIREYKYDWRKYNKHYDDNLESKTKRKKKSDLAICKEYLTKMDDAQKLKLKKYIEKKIFPKNIKNA